VFRQLRLKRVIKKIAALSAGATMVGATLLGAMAADLGDYPSPLVIKDGQFTGILVVGDKADAKDIIGITDIMGSLQYAATKTVASGATTTASISEGVKIDKSSSHLNIEESFADVFDTGIDVDDLPHVLPDADYEESEGDNKNEVEYEQELKFTDETAKVVFAQDDDDAPIAGDYLYLSKTLPAYQYILDFDDDVEYNNASSPDAADDFETTTLEIQGNRYTITDIKLSGGKIDKIYLQAGETTVWLEEGVTLMRTIGDIEHEVVLVDVSDDASASDRKCGISVDGTTEWVEVGSSAKINGVEIGVTDAVVIHSATQDTDTCEVNLGAMELMLENGDEIEMGGNDVDGSIVSFVETNSGLAEININYTPEDEIFIAPGGAWADPVLGNFKYSYEGLTKSTEMIEIKASGDDAELKVMNNDGKEIKIPIHNNQSDSSQMLLGTSGDMDDQFYIADPASALVATDVTDFEGIQLLKVLSNGEAHIIELKDIDKSNDKITFADDTYGGEKTTDYGADAVVGKTIELPEGSLIMDINETAGTISWTDVNEFSSTVGLFETKNEGEINIVEGTPGSINISLIENPDGSNDDGLNTQTTITIALTYDFDSDKEIDVGGINFADGNYSGPHDYSDDNDDDKMYMTYFGTLVELDQEDKRKAELWYPQDEVYGNAFVSKIGAVTTTATESGESVVILRIEVGATKLASEVSNVKAQNSIIVGGPCANSAAAEALGNPADCAAGFEEGKGLIQLVEFTTGKVAVIVAGYSADDTRNAATVLANYKDYALSGTKVEVSKVGTQYTVTESE
jgi:hypothetical protein